MLIDGVVVVVVVVVVEMLKWNMYIIDKCIFDSFCVCVCVIHTVIHIYIHIYLSGCVIASLATSSLSSPKRNWQSVLIVYLVGFLFIFFICKSSSRRQPIYLFVVVGFSISSCLSFTTRLETHHLLFLYQLVKFQSYKKKYENIERAGRGRLELISVFFIR